MPNRPELAVAIVTVAANAACAPINPAYSAEELDRYFADLKPRALITPGGDRWRGAPRGASARRAGIRPDRRRARLPACPRSRARRQASRRHDPLGPGATALLLLTSGTTSRPKIVPLTHANICTSAYSAVAALQLREADRCLNVLPLFHGHGLIATVMASLAAGGERRLHAGLRRQSLLRLANRDFAPTWYSAVPTMHQAILAQARLNPDQVAGIGCASSAPPRLRCRRGVFAELEQTFEHLGDRILRHDGNRFRADRLQSAAAAQDASPVPSASQSVLMSRSWTNEGRAAGRPDRPGRGARRKRHAWL